MNKISYYMRKIKDNPYILLKYMINAGLVNWLSDAQFIYLNYRSILGKKLNLTNPQTFNEKLQWLKLYDRRPEYTTMVDKYAVKKYVADIIGEEYIIPTLGVWDDPDDIDFDKLPNQFVLKCNHNSGLGMCICKDKSELNIDKVKRELRKGLKQDYYLTGREWAYKNVKRKIIAEKYMIDKHDYNDLGLIDYKFFCFNGIPKFAYVAQGAAKEYKSNINMMSLNWTLMPFQRTDHPQFNNIPKKPINFDKMIAFSKKLAKKTTFVRVDFYEINSKLYFGELTFYPGSGYIPFTPEDWDCKLGSWLELPKE